MSKHFKQNFQYLKHKRQWLKGLFCFIAAVIVIGAVSSQFGFLISETDSLPQHYFLQAKYLSPKKGHYTLVWSNWYADRVIKKVLGIGGDKIWYDDTGILFVNDVAIGIPYLQASDGRTLTPLPEQIISDGYVFLYAEHPKSFDSRYQELGLVPVSQLQGRVFPLQ